MTRFDDLMTTAKVLVADGAMGTTLFELGLEGGGCPEMLNLEQPELIEKVHRGFVDAGSDIILTNTFGGNAFRLELHDLQDRVAELNIAAVSIAREVADSSDRPVAVAASIGPTGELFHPLGELEHDDGVEAFAEQMAACVEAGADVLWIETISSFEELNAATDAAGRFDIPFVATMSFDTAGHTMMGITPTQFGEWLAGRETPPQAIGANCGIGPGDGVATVFDLTALDPAIATITKANCGIPIYNVDRLVYPVGPSDMAEYVELAIRSGARIIGACCGSTPEHLAAIRHAVDVGATGDRPKRSEVESRLGAHGHRVVKERVRRR